MSAAIRSDPAGGKMYLVVDGADVAEVTPAGIEADDFTIGGIAIVEQGSNGDGEYVKLADGTQVCWGHVVCLYASAPGLIETWTYPSAFSANPHVLHTATGAHSGIDNAERSESFERCYAIGTTSCIVAFMSDGVYVAGDYQQTSAVAIGRWF